MKKTLAKILLFLFCLILLMTMAACAPAATPESAPAPETAKATESASTPESEAAKAPESAPAPEPEQVKKKIGFTFFVFNDEFTQGIRKGIVDACAEYGWDVNVQDANYDTATQVSQMEAFIAAKVDAIILGTIEPDALIPVCLEAQEADIPVFQINGITREGKGATGLVDVNYYQSGVECGTYASSLIDSEYGGKANVVILTNPISKVVAAACESGFRDAILTHPGATIVAEETFMGSGTLQENGMRVLETLLQRDQVDIVYACADTPVFGAIDAMKAAGYTKAIGVSTFWSSQAFKMIESGDPFYRMGSAQNPIAQANGLAQQIKSYFETGECEFKSPVKTDVITKDTIEAYNWRQYFDNP